MRRPLLLAVPLSTAIRMQIGKNMARKYAGPMFNVHDNPLS